MIAVLVVLGILLVIAFTIVGASITFWSDSLRISRSDSRWSRSTPPSTDRSVVWEIWSVALWKFSTALTALLGSTTR